LHSSQRGWRAVSRSLRRQDKYSICRSHFGSIVRSISCLRDGGIVSNAPGQRLLSKPMSHGRLCEVVIAANTVLPSAEQLCLVYHYCTLTWFAFITHTLDCTLICMACCPPRGAILDIVCRLDPLSPTIFQPQDRPIASAHNSNNHRFSHFWYSNQHHKISRDSTAQHIYSRPLPTLRRSHL